MIRQIKGEIVQAFDIKGVFMDAKPHGEGYINDTFACYFKKDNKVVKRYLLQRINHEVFSHPEELMENFRGVTDFLKKVIIENGGNPERETLTIVKTKEGKDFYLDKKGNYWRMIKFIEDTISYTVVNGIDDLYKTAYAFGNFQNLLAKYPAKKLHETIPNFHNTLSRYKDFEKAVENDEENRVQFIEEELKIINKFKPLCSALLDLLESGEVPLKVTHNDTKLNNILMDATTKEGICIIDLDTIMPGLVAYDYGDSVRAGCCWSAEDERDLNKVYLDLELYEAYTEGFIRGANGSLTSAEVYSLPLGAKVITFELALRFLTDFLNGDTYFKTDYYMHNLDRTKTQLKLVEDMDDKWEKMIEILESIIERNK